VATAPQPLPDLLPSHPAADRAARLETYERLRLATSVGPCLPRAGGPRGPDDGRRLHPGHLGDAVGGIVAVHVGVRQEP
jgi:hypothetical protein